MIKAFYLSCCTLFLSAATPNPEIALEIGAPIPKAELTWQDISGKEISLNAAKGKNGLLVIFAGNHCPYMHRNQDRIKQISQVASKNGIGVIMINSNEATRNEGESLAAMKEYAATMQYHGYYIVDKNSALADAFDANHTPECFLFDKTGKLVYKGAIDDSPGNAETVKVRLLQNAINETLAGKAVNVATSNSLGCNIRRRL
ncbi:Peroxiredoxin [Chitinophaga terrae (ex Kim and Jung 2007)]|jgi:thioredoxin-related protein|uniref:Peroxiredoxin n=1 Tax=Chitinophaga terrae (ex Kim and Jung 2007) TaxID=408074 RepID=A0A1H3YPW0_9BACT|nr:redoxin family protein [Chitinophaga terrae (ex Kim and Jung 2007)]GEP88415.1 thioredoxin family protein [Chitinophaga terrae (ex Kim and Jung 2007)]SEA13062.1 Peroxiredoxin [Chitinophaga terrae (ex Kim and Jung 2007)]